MEEIKLRRNSRVYFFDTFGESGDDVIASRGLKGDGGIMFKDGFSVI